jgi:serine/threonine-protein phosphatase 6 regulatory subunit 3
MEKLIQFMLVPNSTSTLINGVTIIIDIIRHNNMDMNHETSFAIVLGYNHQFMPPSISLIPMLTVLTRNIQQLNDILLIKKEQVNPTLHLRYTMNNIVYM